MKHGLNTDKREWNSIPLLVFIRVESVFHPWLILLNHVNRWRLLCLGAAVEFGVEVVVLDGLVAELLHELLHDAGLDALALGLLGAGHEGIGRRQEVTDAALPEELDLRPER